MKKFLGCLLTLVLFFACTSDVCASDFDSKTEEYIIANADGAINLLESQTASATRRRKLRATQSAPLYYGNVSDYLTQKDDYDLYSISLSTGDFLQIKLTNPTDGSLDYDLLLLDSSLSIIKMSNYVTYYNNGYCIEESIGYIAESDIDTMYICVYASVGGSAEQAYDLSFSIAKTYDENEIDDFASEATNIDLSNGVTTIERTLNSPLDNDWYVVSLAGAPEQEQLSMYIDSSSETNGCTIEIYQNLGTNCFAMAKIGAGNGGEVKLPAGTYYIRIRSTNDFSNYDSNDVPTYSLRVAAVSKVDKIVINRYEGNAAKMIYDYPEGAYYRIEEVIPQTVSVIGYAYYYDQDGNLQPASNVLLSGTIIDEQWKEINRPDMSTVTAQGRTDENGRFEIPFNLHSALGGLRYDAPVSRHFYDYMTTEISTQDGEVIGKSHFYILKFTKLY